ncbi:alkaline phosphatase family protein [Parashewanella spongiae]|uniref:Alkaline phosphatase family protein n=1 Tax=Parashewanella spongiae TaxID=342950 RepID=A0A3A6TF83_9GAMM|nr:alkaline phosphatase D family protein [Parashewanella spongiae]MCL1080030.1 alkaline phosphatase family protein [Parashewanella spongiae]RJY07456.1 alkaline phosphatase family protein [Parashewanella spongiae]
MTSTATSTLPSIISGPILRHCDCDNFTLWFVSSTPIHELSVTLSQNNQSHTHALNDGELHYVPLGQRAHQYLIQLNKPALLDVESIIEYQVFNQEGKSLFQDIQGLCYPKNKHTNFVVKTEVDHLLHGSCRNAHHSSDDALVAADLKFAKHLTPQERPALLMMSGDQVYVDDISGPMLFAIAQVIQLLGLPSEPLPNASITDSSQLDYSATGLYRRANEVLPNTQHKTKTALWHWYTNKPIFTSLLAENHLVSLSEVIALYLLYWSPELWNQIDIPKQLPDLPPAKQKLWRHQWTQLLKFKAGLPQVRRLLAHIPTYMIFDDHDVTDDWNLTARWEQAAYENPMAKRIIGNALIGYALFQGLGNAPKKFTHSINPLLKQFFDTQSSAHQDELIQALLKFEDWHYSLNTSPKVVVIDSRTRRWRSESNLGKPSGLLDWEGLMDFQAELIDQSKVIIVSPAPMFGVKLIETIQRTATLLGASLLVDAENWMAHPGSANGLLNIFQHRRTPQEFVILSGDVHYSFAYDVHVRGRDSSPNIYQICCSGIKNQFPEKLLPFFNRVNGWLFGYFSPLNWFTKRKKMLIRGRRPDGHRSDRLVNNSGIGVVRLDQKGAPTEISVLHGDGSKTNFEPPRHSYFD